MFQKSAAGMIVLAAVFLTSACFAQGETINGSFYRGCGPTDGPATVIALDNNIRVTVFKATLEPDAAYRTHTQTFEGEQQTMSIAQCDAAGANCVSIEGVLSMHAADGETAEGTIEAFDGTETQGDAESIQGKMHRFKAVRDKEHAPEMCG